MSGDISVGDVHRPAAITLHPHRVPSLRAPATRGAFKVGLLSLTLASALLVLDGCAWPTLFKRTPEPAAPSPTLRAQTRLLQDAQEVLQQGHTRKSITLLRNLIDSHPHSPILPEMRWTLGRAYERSGDLRAAVEEYRRLLEITEPSRSGKESYRGEAQRRITALEPNLSPILATASAITAILIHPTQLPHQTDLQQWLKNLAEAGVTMLIIESATKPSHAHPSPHTSRQNARAQGSPQAGVYFRTQWALVVEDYLEQVVPLAHEQGLSVFGALTLRRMNWLEPPVGWADWTYNPEQNQLQRSRALDLFHPGFQEYLRGLLGDLADTGIDGFLFRADAPIGAAGGFSPFALEGFRRSFDVDLDPSTLFIREEEKTLTYPMTKERHDTSVRLRHTADFWRWAGWKAREQLRIMSHLMDSLRRRAPDMRFVLELHPEALHDPVYALVHYTEDLLETTRAGFDHILTGPDSGDLMSPSTEAHQSSGAHSVNQERTESLSNRLVELVGDPRRVWIARPLPAGALSAPSQHLNPQADRVRLARHVGLVYRQARSTFLDKD